MNDLAPPVKAIIKVIDTGIKLTNKLSESVDSVTASTALDISESAPRVKKSLQKSAKDIRDAYTQHVQACGEPFTQALLDGAVQNRLKNLKNDLRDKIDESEEFEDDPNSFDPAVFDGIREQAQKCSIHCLGLFEDIRSRVAVPSLVEETQDDRSQLKSMQQWTSLRRPVTPPSQPNSQATLLQAEISPRTSLSGTAEPPQPRSSWSMDSPTLGRSLEIRREHTRDISPSTPAEGQLRFIPKEQVHSRISANDDFLERRRQSRALFMMELRKSITSIDENRESIVSDVSAGSGGALSPITRSQRQISMVTTSSGDSSIHQDRPSTYSHDSQDSIFGNRAAASSPPIATVTPRTIAEPWENPPIKYPNSKPAVGAYPGIEVIPAQGMEVITPTINIPTYPPRITPNQPGIEVVTPNDHYSELIPVDEPENPNRPQITASIKSMDYPIPHDGSFYKYGGFCEGSKALLRGDTGFRVVKRPAGHYSATVSARCIKCAYEVGWNEVEKDRLLDRKGIYGNSGIRWRQKFISKCHLKTTSINEAIYACLFCIEERRTVEEHDATVFFSVTQLFRHLAKHSQPLPNIAGLNILYGPQPAHVLDFDIHFTIPEPQFSQYCVSEISQKITTRPAAHALTTHHPKNSRSDSRDPDGNPVLHFAAGARIVGITFPDHFQGNWCVGYHDGERGAFPTSAVMLEMPAKEDVWMNDQSSLIAFAKWDFKPKDERKDGGWLKFSKGDKISCIGYAFQDQWCWSGQNAKGKFGIFPQAFVEGLQDGTRMAVSPSGSRSGGFGLSSRMHSFQLGRNKSGRHEGHMHGRQGSVRSVSSGGSIGGVSVPGGLEVVQSPIHGSKNMWGR